MNCSDDGAVADEVAVFVFDDDGFTIALAVVAVVALLF